MTAPPISERQFQRQVTDYAELYGWSWMHIRAGRTDDSWRTPVSGPLGQGWPDLVLIRGGELIFIEVKAQAGKLTPHQDRVQHILAQAARVYTVRPSDWGIIEAVIGRKAA